MNTSSVIDGHIREAERKPSNALLTRLPPPESVGACHAAEEIVYDGERLIERKTHIRVHFSGGGRAQILYECCPCYENTVSQSSDACDRFWMLLQDNA